MTENSKQVSPFTWSALGYRRLGGLAQAHAGGRTMLEMLQLVSGYEAQRPDWIRHSSRRRHRHAGTISIIKHLDRSFADGSESFGFVDDYIEWAAKHLPNDVPRVFAKLQDLEHILAKGTSDEPWRFIKHLVSAVAFAELSHLKHVLRSGVLPAFFNRYPNGRVLVVQHRFAFHGMNAGLRALYAGTQVPPQDWNSQGIGSCDTLRHWHSIETDELGFLVLQMANYVWNPFVTGFVGGQAGLRFHFLFDPPEEYKPPAFPADWLTIPLFSAGFGEENRDLYTALAGGFDHPEHKRMAHRRFLSGDCPVKADQLLFLDWLVGAVNELLYNLSDAANFTSAGDPDGQIDPLLGFEHLLTIERIVRRTLAAMSLRDVGSAKSAVFEIADLFGGLSVRFGKSSNDAEFFKTLFDPSMALSLMESLQKIPGVGQQLFEMASAIYNDLESTVLASVWIRQKVGKSGVTVRDKTLQTEIHESSGEFVANVMRAYRNAHHGYFTEGDPKARRPSRYLWLVDGNVPDSITTLPLLWLMAYLVDQSFTGWKPLPIGAFD